jgi:thiosulfate/3-mercaptopyruvate sulfurtransferase
MVKKVLSKSLFTTVEITDWVGRPTILVYGDDVRESARLWWLLRYMGCPDVRLINGGMIAYQASNKPIEKEEGKSKASPLDLQRVAGLKSQLKLLADKQVVLAAVAAKNLQIIDARSEKEHCGDQKLSKRGGAIPGAIGLEWVELLDPKTKKFLSAPELEKLFAERGIDVNQPTVTYCQSGGRASVMFFGLSLMGVKDVQNYYASWSEWGNDPNTPIEPGKKRSK